MPGRFPKRTHYAAELDGSQLGKTVRVAGWVEDVRSLGSLVFVTVRDVTSSAQAVFKKESVEPEVYGRALEVPRQSVVVLEGKVTETKAKGLKVELSATKLHILSPAVHPLPLDPTGRVEASIDTRLDARALDLRKPVNRAIFVVRSVALQAIRKTFLEKGFLEVNTPKVIGAGAEGGATLFKVDYFGNEAYLAQSPQLYKEQLTASLDKVFEIADYFRGEKSHTRRHLSEFVSIDAEAAFWDEEDAMGLAEDIIIGSTMDVQEKCRKELEILGHTLIVPSKPFPRLTHEQCLEEIREGGFQVEKGEDIKDEHLAKLGENHSGYYFVVDWPVKLKPFYIERKEGTELSRSFDLQHEALEIASGGLRVSRREDLERRLMEEGIEPKSFEEHLRVFSWGIPPHSGWGMGFDRLVMVLTGRRNIRDVVLYPRDQFRLRP